METVIRVSRHRKCPGSIDLIKAEGDWIERTHKRKPPYGISCYMLSFGDLDNPELDCEIYLTTFELAKLQEYLNGITVYEIPDCHIEPKPLNIMVRVAADNLETCSMSGVSLSTQMHCLVWKRNPPQFTDFDSTNELYWVLEFTEFRLGYGGQPEEYYATQIQIECASFQLAELRGAINGLLSQLRQIKSEEEERGIDRVARDKKIKDGEEEKRKQRVAVLQAVKSSAHRGSC
jgi:hypothetical protein